MQKIQKRKSDPQDGPKTPSKKVKFADKTPPPNKTGQPAKKPIVKTPKKLPAKAKSFSKPDKPKPFTKNGKFDKKFAGNKEQTKPADWNEFKKKKKEVREKRKQSKSLYEVITKAKQIGEKLRVKKLEGGSVERTKLVNELHDLMGNKGNYVKFVLAHDMARIVQYMLKFGAENVRQEIIKELIPASVQMIQSKYGKFVIKGLLKYGNGENRADCFKAFYGNAVKLSSHAVSAPIFEYAYATYASPADKINLIQEFYGDMYKQTKDPNVKHLHDVYKNTADMKKAVLSNMKGNLTKILNKDLLDSGLVQSALCQFMEECSAEDKTELINELAPHITIISNSKDGAKVAMQCIWHGTNKDRKVAMKALKEHAVELCKHEYGHCAIIALFDAIDDTILLNKLVLDEVLKSAGDLITDEYGRRVLLWLVQPADTIHFHPQFINELKSGRESSSCKKDPEIRQKELLKFSSGLLLKAIAENVNDWFGQASRAVVTLAILKSGRGEELQTALSSIAQLIANPEWRIHVKAKINKVQTNETEIMGIEDPGIHMILKKLAANDKALAEDGETTFGNAVVELLNDDIIKSWVKLNRGCFLLVTLFENNGEDLQKIMITKLQKHLKLIKKQETSGAKILLKKISI